MYNEDYYWYLNSDQFKKLFHNEISKYVTTPVLDIGCGEGQISECIAGEYTDLDASSVAIQKAKNAYPKNQFICERFESYKPDKEYKTLIFGGILYCLVKKKDHLRLIDKYANTTKAKMLIIYDLMKFDTTHIEKKYQLKHDYNAIAQVPGLEEAKKHRFVKVFKL